MENYSGPYEAEMHVRYLDLISLDNPKQKAEWKDSDIILYEREHMKEDTK